ncbi:MAG: tRNA (guanosine(46)-N7)-methyltransferase TrmB [Bacteroidota bacterium]
MRKKLLRFQDNALATNVIEKEKPLYHKIKGQWHAHFGNHYPITLELGCGRGTYTVALAKHYHKQNFIGVDIKGARLWAGSQQAIADNLLNVAFLRTEIAFLANFFGPKEVAEIYLTFPDPHPTHRGVKRRLTSPRFLALYEQLLQPQGKIHLKTDNEELFAYTQETLSQGPYQLGVVVEDVHHQLPEEDIHRQIQTPYEKRFLAAGMKIKYLNASFLPT